MLYETFVAVAPYILPVTLTVIGVVGVWKYRIYDLDDVAVAAAMVRARVVWSTKPRTEADALVFDACKLSADLFDADGQPTGNRDFRLGLLRVPLTPALTEIAARDGFSDVVVNLTDARIDSVELTLAGGTRAVVQSL